MQATSLKRPVTRDILTIGAVAEKTGCTVPTIRYYEEIGLLPPARRRASGHRIYSAITLELLMFIRQCRDLGFSIDYIRTLVALSNSGDQDCGAVRDIAQKRLDVVRAKLLELQALEQSLSSFVSNCTSSCSEGPAPQCSIFHDIAANGAPGTGSGCCG